MNWYKNKTVLVTGGTSGIGAEMVRRLAAIQARVIFCGRDEAALRKMAVETGARGIRVDLADRGGRKYFIQNVFSAGRIDILVNNAGFGNMALVAEADKQVLQQMLAVNMEAVIELTRGFLGQKPRPQQGGILNVGSVASFLPTPGSAVYGATKHFIVGLTDALHAELSAAGIHVTGLYPGKTHTAFLTRATGGRRPFWDQAMPAGEVAEAGLAGLARNEIRVVPGMFNRAVVLAARWLPAAMVLALSSRPERSSSN